MRYYNKRLGKYYYRRRHKKRHNRSYNRNYEPRNVYQYIKKCFFELSEWQLTALEDYYGKKYGDNAKNYLKRTYEKWRSGETGVSGQTETRILECVPRFLSTEEQFCILQYYIPSIQAKLKPHGNIKIYKIEELNTVFNNIVKSIYESDYRLDWFTKEVFSQEEIDEFIGVLKYTMLDTLNRSYKSVREDISFLYNHMTGKMSVIDGSIKLEYIVKLLNIKIELPTTKPILEEDIFVEISTPDMITKFQKQYRQILLDYSLDCLKHDAHGSHRKHIGLYDLNVLLNSVNEICDHNEYNAGLEIEGSGGLFIIGIEKKCQLNISIQIFKKAILICLILIGLIIAYIFITEFMLAFSIYVLIGFFSFLTWQLREIKDLYMEMKNYEQRKAKKFAEN